MSFWLCFVITEAYRWPLEPNQAAMKVRVHSVRSIGTSLLFKKKFAVQQILRAGMWKSHTMFTSFCLRDVTHRSIDTSFIGPVVTTQ